MMLSARHLILGQLFGLAVLTGLPLGATDPKVKDTLTAQQIIDQTVAVYSECTSYQDAGTVVTTYTTPDRTWSDELQFSTAFVRPDRFRFVYKDTDLFKKPRRYLIWRKGEEVKTWWDISPGVGTGKSLNEALAAATGVSRGSAHTVPALLLPLEVTGVRLSDLKDAQRKEDKTLGAQECFVITGKYVGKGQELPQTVWVDKKTFLLRRAERSFDLKDGRAEQVATYEPLANGDIPESALVFDPPSGQ
jgi:outer membrane lipoprotein-sorting protein